MLNRRIVLAALLALSVAPAWASEVRLIAPQDAHEKKLAGEMLLVDVRTPEEWEALGVAEGAERIAMQDPELGNKLYALTGGDKTAPIALICQTGFRSGRVASAMLRAGYTNVYSVRGGMAGRDAAPGWAKLGLPMTSTK